MEIIYIVLGIVIVVLLLFLVTGGVSSDMDLPENIKDKDIRRIAKEGEKIKAIKWYRDLHQVGIKEAKEAVDKMIAE
jgi:ribosomal protein L7/L12